MRKVSQAGNQGHIFSFYGERSLLCENLSHDQYLLDFLGVRPLVLIERNKFIDYYNLERSHQGYRLQGRTPAQALREALGSKELPPIKSPQIGEIEEEPTEGA